jgi:S1-C subfamily serine protease
MPTRTVVVVALAAMLLAGAQSSHAWNADDARKIADAHKDAVVSVQLVIETVSSYEGESEKRESKASATGTVIDPSGLVVASLAETNPSEMMNRFMADEEGVPKSSSRTVDVKIRLADGTEIPADVVLRDRDLDLTFLRPRKAPEAPMAYLDLSQAGAADTLDDLLVLSRLGTVVNRALGADIYRVRAVVTKPRTFYALMISYQMNLGGPAFTMDGKVAGILLLRSSPVGNRESMSSSSMDDMMTPVVMPCSTIAPIAEQAKKAAPIKEAEKPAAPAKTAPAKPAAKK